MGKVYARCTNPKVDYLTDGKLYEVFQSPPFDFEINCDDGDIVRYDWNDRQDATWERVEQQDPPQWALDKAARAGKRRNWKQAKSKNNRPEIASIRAHAATLAKYEKEPVDPVLVKARELLADVYLADGAAISAQAIKDAKWDYGADIRAIMEALRLPAMGGDE